MLMTQCDHCGRANAADATVCVQCGRAIAPVYDPSGASSPRRKRFHRAPPEAPPKVPGTALILVIGAVQVALMPRLLSRMDPDGPNRAFELVVLCAGPVNLALGILMRRGTRWALYVATAYFVGIAVYATSLDGLVLSLGSAVRAIISVWLLAVSATELFSRR